MYYMDLSATVWPLKLLPVSAKPEIASASVVFDIKVSK